MHLSPVVFEEVLLPAGSPRETRALQMHSNHDLHHYHQQQELEKEKQEASVTPAQAT
jgi:hypothetical protein